MALEDIITRAQAGRPLTHLEGDTNLLALKSGVQDALTAAATASSQASAAETQAAVVAAQLAPIQAELLELRSLVDAGGVAPSAPQSFTAGTATPTTQPLSWTAPSSGTGTFTYSIARRVTGEATFPAPQITGLTTTSATITGLEVGFSYDYLITATNSAGTGPAASLLNRKTAGTNQLMIFGDSTGFGIAASTTTKRWSTQRALKLGIPLVNNSISGTVMQNRASHTGSPLADNGRSRFQLALLGAALSRFYDFLYGLNDLRFTGAPATMNLANFITDFTYVVQQVIAAGVPAANIRIGSTCWIPDDGYGKAQTVQFTGSSRVVHEQFADALHQIAFDNGCRYAPVYEYMRDNGGEALVDPDDIHPNDAGQLWIEKAFEDAVVPTSGVWTGGTPAPVDTTAPQITSAAVNGTNMVLSYSEVLASPGPAASAYSVTIDGQAQVPSGASLNGANVTLTLGTPATNGQTVTVTYAPPGTNPVRDAASNAAAALTAHPVNNNTPLAGAGGTPTAVSIAEANAAWRELIPGEKYDSSTGGSTFDATARIDGTVTVGTEAWVEIQFGATDAGGVIVFDPVPTLTAFTATPANRAFLAQLINDGRVYQAVAGAVSAPMSPTFQFSGFTATTWVRLHIAADGVVSIQTTTDDGVNWVKRQDLGTPVAPGTVLHCRLYNTNARKMYKPRQVGFTLV
jgi:uncharacterized repeat protein (TIGR02059 family)